MPSMGDNATKTVAYLVPISLRLKTLDRLEKQSPVLNSLITFDGPFINEKNRKYSQLEVFCFLVLKKMVDGIKFI